MRDDGVHLPDGGCSRIGTVVNAQSEDRPSASDSGPTGSDTEEPAYTASFDSTEVPPSVAVVYVVSEVADTDPLELEPLYATVNPDSLDSLVSGIRAVDGDVQVAFRFAGYHVTIKSYGRITVRE